MNNNICKEYLTAVKSFFPTIGKEEKKYLNNLCLILEDYHEEQPDSTMDDLCQEFGTPIELVANFYYNANPSRLIERINLFANTKKILYAILITIAFIALTYCFYAYKSYKVFEQNRIFSEETIIE